MWVNENFFDFLCPINFYSDNRNIISINEIGIL